MKIKIKRGRVESIAADFSGGYAGGGDQWWFGM